MASENNKFLKSIYLADDDEDDRMLFIEAIQEVDQSIAVTEAKDGQQLLDILNSDSLNLPEIIFLDINMPGKGGFECLQEIRNSNTDLKSVNIIMLSTSSSSLSIDKAFELGASFYAVKPSTFDGLKKLIKKTLEMNLISVDQHSGKVLLA
ncbi:response regulator [Flavobacterium ajazii]|uniref:response regulator n=1 Tax=Flavobacterium ajazii TaxID=2692318 RepID=UPI0013D89D79|nr:response regulator [Flavobacterium ajazii]